MATTFISTPIKAVRSSTNFQLSFVKSRRVIENTFGILRARWHVFSRPIQASVETAEEITKAAVCLHNYLRQTNSASYCPSGFVDSEDGSGDIRPGEWRQVVRNNSRGALSDIAPLRGGRYSNSAIEVREALMKYFVSDSGSLPWQWNHVRSRSQIVSKRSMVHCLLETCALPMSFFSTL